MLWPCVLALLLKTASAQPAPGTAPATQAKERDISGTFEFDPGYRRDSFNYNIASHFPGIAAPNVLSEAAWQRLLIYEFDFRMHVEINHGLYAKWKLGFGNIDAGTVQASDYGADGRTGEWSRVLADAKFGHTFDTSLGFGYRIKLGRHDETSLIPLLGYSYDKQTLSMRYGTQVLSSCPPSPPFPAGTCAAPLGNVAGLDSSLKALWTGTWLGLDFETKAFDHFLIGAGIEHHFHAKYKASGNLNLRTDLQHPISFTQAANAEANNVLLSVRYLPANNWSIGLIAERQEWAAGPGTHTYNTIAGSTPNSLNKVRWNSMAGTLSLQLRH